MDLEKIIFQRNEIEKAIRKVAIRVLDWAGPGTLQIVSILEGAKPFTTGLVQVLRDIEPSIEIHVHEVRIRATQGTSLLDHRAWDSGGLGRESMEGQKVLLVDDLADSGKTLAFLKKAIGGMGPLEIKTSVLVRKYGPEKCPVDFCGLELGLDQGQLANQGLKDCWLFGFGMDLDGGRREMDQIGWVEIPF
jgi:hypoxanthine-guanine phosphoribosyltransferase